MAAFARPRVRADFQPNWHGPIEGWVRNYIASNKWRVEPHHDAGDMFSEAFLAFAKCEAMYPEVVDPRHFMRLFQRTFMNKIHNLASARTKRYALAYDENGDREDGTGGNANAAIASQQRRSVELDETELNLLIEDAPHVVRALIDAVMDAPEELLGFLRDEWHGLRETRAQRFARLAGVDAVERDQDGTRESTDAYTARLGAIAAQVECWALGELPMPGSVL